MIDANMPSVMAGQLTKKTLDAELKLYDRDDAFGDRLYFEREDGRLLIAQKSDNAPLPARCTIRSAVMRASAIGTEFALLLVEAGGQWVRIVGGGESAGGGNP
jgi:hypothetical protein